MGMLEMKKKMKRKAWRTTLTEMKNVFYMFHQLVGHGWGKDQGACRNTTRNFSEVQG